MLRIDRVLGHASIVDEPERFIRQLTADNRCAPREGMRCARFPISYSVLRQGAGVRRPDGH
jgi:hypothetical protein